MVRAISLWLSVAFIVATVGVQQCCAQSNPDWTKPFQPFRIAGNLYYVGTADLGVFLITTSEGHILINSTLEANVPLIQSSVEKLGFRFSDIKILLISHAHFDHCAASATIKTLTGAKYMVMEGDVGVVETGGKTDFAYGDIESMLYKPAAVDRVLRHLDTLRLGDAVLVAHHTPGHTKGCTTWSIPVTENGRTYNAVVLGSSGVNPDYKLVDNSKYANIADDYRRSFRHLNDIRCDIFLGSHAGFYGLKRKAAALKADSSTGKAESGAISTESPFVDPKGYAEFVALKSTDFERELERQQRTRTVSVTLDDLPYVQSNLAEAEQGTAKLLDALYYHRAQADVFIIGSRVEFKDETEARRGLIRKWIDDGHVTHNHSYTHLRYSATNTAEYLEDVTRGQGVVRSIQRNAQDVESSLSNAPDDAADEKDAHVSYYRAPYNDLGGSEAKRDSLLALLKQQNVRLAPFTVEHSDYMFEVVYNRALSKGDSAYARRVAAAYLEQLDSAFAFAEHLSVETFGREIPQVFLIHANRINADYLDTMLTIIERRKYRFVSMREAVSDTAYNTPDAYTKRWGVSWLHRWRESLGLSSARKREPEPPTWILEEYQLRD